jgi:hypothetical protein
MIPLAGGDECFSYSAQSLSTSLYFGVILLAGAEINAFYAQGKRALPENLAVLVHDVTQNVPKGEEEVQDKQGT